MARAVGIDLGTTNSVVAVLEGGEPTVIANAEGSRTTPSVVAFAKSGEVLVGEVAKRQAVTNVDHNTISSVKRHMGTDWTASIEGKEYTPQEISARILGKLKTDAESYLGEPVTDAVITVPAYFNDAQRQARRTPARSPASTSCASSTSPPPRRCLWPREGQGGRAHPRLRPRWRHLRRLPPRVGKDDDGFSTIQVKATNGDNKLGGDDWDQRVVEWLISQVKNKEGVDLSKDKARRPSGCVRRRSRPRRNSPRRCHPHLAPVPLDERERPSPPG
jgi:molecular chaperone DnaK